jgi:hypothetical protein
MYGMLAEEPIGGALAALLIFVVLTIVGYPLYRRFGGDQKK